VRLARDAREHEEKMRARTEVRARLTLGRERRSGSPPHSRVPAAETRRARERAVVMGPAKRVELFTRLRELNPHPTTELEYSSPYELLVAVMLSAQATDAGVNKATRHLFKAANTPQKMLALGEAGVRNFIASIGLFNTKRRTSSRRRSSSSSARRRSAARARRARGAAGLGRKTANVVLNTAFGEPTIAVDTHIFRVRTGPASRRARTRSRSSSRSRSACPASSSRTRTTG
jgi:endonuclease-3